MRKIKKIMFGSLCLAAALFTATAVSHTPGQEIVYAATDKSGLYHEGNSWNYYEDGQIAADKTTLVKYNGSWWYIENGRVNFNTETLCKYNGSWWYVEGGRVNFGKTTLCKYNGSWWFVRNGKVDFSSRTLCKYNGTWWYVNGGKVYFSAETVVKYASTWYYVKNGQVNWNATTLCKYNDAWWYIRNGKIDFSSTTLCRYGESHRTRTFSDGTTERLYDWYYVHGGKVDFSARTLCKYNGTWWFVESGKVNYYDNTLVKYGNNWYCVIDGKVAWNKSLSRVKYNGHEYEVRNGIVDFSAGVDYYVYNDSMITYVSGCPYPLYKIFYDDRGYPYYYGKWGGSANMDADNLHKTEACSRAIGDYMLFEKRFSYIGESWRSLGTYDGFPVVVRYIQIPGETDSPESYGIPF